MRKTVFSWMLDHVTWRNVTLVKGDLVTEARKLKQQPAADLVILGSGSIVSQLTQARLIDEYQIVVNPIVIGKGRTVFETVEDRANLTQTKTRSFKNGNVVLWYESAPIRIVLRRHPDSAKPRTLGARLKGPELAGNELSKWASWSGLSSRSPFGPNKLGITKASLPSLAGPWAHSIEVFAKTNPRITARRPQ